MIWVLPSSHLPKILDTGLAENKWIYYEVKYELGPLTVYGCGNSHSVNSSILVRISWYRYTIGMKMVSNVV
jgi:hypothetical protein